MAKTKLVYLWSLRNAAADRAGRMIQYKGAQRYMKSPLEYLAEALDTTPLGERYSLEAVIHDDDPESALDRSKLDDIGFGYQPGQPWLYPPELQVQGQKMNSLLHSVPSSYRRTPLASQARIDGKRDYERRLQAMLERLGAELVVLDGLLVILDELVRPGARYHRRIVNIHPGITRSESPYQRRGAWATLDALHGARGQRVLDWRTMHTTPVPPLRMTGASFHYVDNGIDSGEVIFDVLDTPIDPEDTILELRWNNFNRSLFPALHEGLMMLSKAEVSA